MVNKKTPRYGFWQIDGSWNGLDKGTGNFKCSNCGSYPFETESGTPSTFAEIDDIPVPVEKGLKPDICPHCGAHMIDRNKILPFAPGDNVYIGLSEFPYRIRTVTICPNDIIFEWINSDSIEDDFNDADYLKGTFSIHDIGKKVFLYPYKHKPYTVYKLYAPVVTDKDAVICPEDNSLVLDTDAYYEELGAFDSIKEAEELFNAQKEMCVSHCLNLTNITNTFFIQSLLIVFSTIDENMKRTNDVHSMYFKNIATPKK